VAKPGAHLLAFGGTRTFHRLASAIEDAGWEIRDTVMWVYGSGFPKSLDVSKAIDKEAGAERQVIRRDEARAKRNPHGKRGIGVSGNDNLQIRPAGELVTAPATDAARRWSGWGTALKPAWEPIIVARKPLEGTVAQNVQRHGTGGLNIDGCRIEAAGPSPSIDRRTASARSGKPNRDMHTNQRQKEGLPPWGHDHAQYIAERPGERLGRWPANLIHDGSEEVVGLFPQSKSTGGTSKVVPPWGNGNAGYKPDYPLAHTGGLGDSGSAARFFYCAKASKQDRDEGLENSESQPGGSLKSGDGGWARETERGRKPRHEEQIRARNHHPTVKPTALMRYLLRLVTPPGGIVLDPFAGSGSTGKAAALEGFRFVGIEIDPEYLTIAAARIRAAVPPLFAGSLKNKGSSVSHRSPPVARRTKDGGLAGSGGRGELPFSARSRARVAHGPRVVLRSDDRVVSRD
jgi:site-specific DNA-methyltransferase (adenine-specific)